MSHSSFLKISGVETSVECWGRWVEEESPDEVIICIPGNPGVTGFYHKYLEKLHSLTGKPIWIIGHAGHEEPVMNNSTFLRKIGPVSGREAIFDLKGQLHHKIEFIERYTSPSTKIHLLGHSVGAWITLELLKDNRVGSRIKSVQLLHPTLQKLAETPNGRWFTSVIKRLAPIILMILHILNSVIPLCIYKFIAKLACLVRGYPSEMEKPIVKYIYTLSTTLEKVIYMASDEMNIIKELDISCVKNNSNKISLIYNKNDKWAPGYLFEGFSSIFPGLCIREVSYDHAFVLKYSNEMATLSNELFSSN